MRFFSRYRRRHSSASSEAPANLPDSPNLSPQSSRALSETETLNNDQFHHFDLQDTYADNFDRYLPFVLRRARLNHDPNDFIQPEDLVEDNDDQPTMLDQPLDEPGPASTIMDRASVNYNTKRHFIVATSFIKNNTYVFPSQQSFDLFKTLRANAKKHRKSSTTIYDNQGQLRLIDRTTSLDESRATVDPRPHSIPVDYKLQGLGLPLFKVHVPYMSNFRKNTPFIIFKRYYEHPPPPPTNDTNDNDDDDDDFELYPFCTVNIKKFESVKRYTFVFTPNANNPQDCFRVVAFQHCFKPFTDFVYKNTRFRILGTALITAYALNYNPVLKLAIVDSDKPSLCDDIVNKPPGFDFLTVIKPNKKRPVDPPQQNVSHLDPQDYPNPHPAPENPLLEDSSYQLYGGSIFNTRDYIPNRLPPFGTFKDAMAYSDSLNFIPRKYSEAGFVEVYQDRREMNGDENSTKSVNIDELVLTCVLLTLRENALRSTARPSNSSLAISSRLGGVGLRGPYGPDLGLHSLAQAGPGIAL